MRLSVTAFAAMFLLPGVLGAQIIPGAPPPNRSAIRAEFMDAVIQGVRATANKWVAAWREHDVETAADLYVDRSFIITPEGNRMSGRDSVTTYLEATMPRCASLETFLLDVDASGRMAMTLERFILSATAAETPAIQGLLLTVYTSDGRTWRIRSQVFRPAPADGTS